MQILWCLQSGRTPAGVPVSIHALLGHTSPRATLALPSARCKGHWICASPDHQGRDGDPVPKEGGEGTLLDEMAFELGRMNRRC